MREEEDLDLLINSALSSYGDPGPDSGLEVRVLARVSNAAAPTKFKAPKTRLRWLWLLTLPAFSYLLFFAFLTKTPQHQMTRTLQPEQPAVSANRIEPPPAVPSKPIRDIEVAGQAAKPQLTEVSPPQPKLDVFPTPRQLTPQEQALVTLATRTSPSQRKSLLAAHKASDVPINIAAIHIDPLEMPEEGKN
jgi:hypothetical protein